MAEGDHGLRQGRSVARRPDRPRGRPRPGPVPPRPVEARAGLAARTVAGVNNRGLMTANGIYQMIARRGRQAGVDAWTHRFRHHFSHTWLDRGGAEGDLMELNGWSSPQMLRLYEIGRASCRERV